METVENSTNYRTIIFDLDGTLLDTSPGIFGSVRYAEKLLDLEPVDEVELRKFLGPPPKLMYTEIYGLSEEEAFNASKAHRQYSMENAIYQAEKYEGIDEVLAVLQSKGFNIGVATLKKQTIAEEILSYYELRHFFDVVVGMDELETMTKSGAIKEVIERIGNGNAVMIGDSEYDFGGAKEVGVDFIGVTYGFGFVENEAYPFMTARTPKELLSIILG